MKSETDNRKQVKERDNHRYRENLRMPIAAVAYLTPKETEVTTRVFVRNISVSGLGGVSIDHHQKGDRVQVKIEVATSSTNVLKGLVYGTVRWSEKDAHKEKYTFGVEFNDIKERQSRLYAGLQELEKAYSKPEDLWGKNRF